MNSAQSTLEPPEVVEARALIKRWKQRHGHDSYVYCIGGGHAGYQARCWNCDWEGAEYPRGDEPLGTPGSRAHKANARRDARQHQEDTKPADWRLG